MGGHNSYNSVCDSSQLSNEAFKLTWRIEFIKSLKKESIATHHFRVFWENLRGPPSISSGNFMKECGSILLNEKNVAFVPFYVAAGHIQIS